MMQRQDIILLPLGGVNDLLRKFRIATQSKTNCQLFCHQKVRKRKKKRLFKGLRAHFKGILVVDCRRHVTPPYDREEGPRPRETSGKLSASDPPRYRTKNKAPLY